MESEIDRQPLAVVIPWFGSTLKGGAEQQAWQIATRLVLRGHPVEVLTTCCRSFADDWAVNHLPEGESHEAGITIRRFPVNPRNRPRFDDLNLELLALSRENLLPGVAPVARERASIWASENINSNALESFLLANGQSYRAVIFIPYLYGVVLRGLPLVASRAWLQPCLHDEAYAYLPDVAATFAAAKGLLFNSYGEMQLAARLFGPMVLGKGHVVGEGVELDVQDPEAVADELPEAIRGGRYVLCLGRRSEEKGTDRLVAAFTEFRRRNTDANLLLVLAGPGEGSYDHPGCGVVDLGLVSEPQKTALIQHCRALLQPSLNESFSRVLFEAWRCGKPAVVHRECLATADAVERSKGGWTAATQEEWVARLESLDCCPDDELTAVGAHGSRFSLHLVDWNQVMARYEQILDMQPGKRVGAKAPNGKMPALHQLLPNLSFGDAISTQAIWIREQLQQKGYRSEIFVRYIDERVRDKCRAYEPGAFAASDGLLYHHSIGSEITPAACSHPGPKWLIYHNITPPEFFQPYRKEHARLLRQGREEMWSLARSFPQSVGVSRYNAEELEMYGFPAPRVLPLAVDPSSWSAPPDEALMKRLQDGRRNLLHVGRYAPNKCQHDLVEAFAHYLRFDPDARLILVGSSEADDPYVRLIQETIERYAPHGEVLLAGHTSAGELHAYYRTAHLFWSMSEHEGFCVPLIEAMWFDLPILAFAAGAIGETLGGAGVTFDQKSDFSTIAALAVRMTRERAVIDPVLRAQRDRRVAFSPDSVFGTLLHMVS